jgi:hypothetical protein
MCGANTSVAVSDSATCIRKIMVCGGWPRLLRLLVLKNRACSSLATADRFVQGCSCKKREQGSRTPESTRLLARHLGAFFAGFRQPDCNRLLPALDAPSLAALSRSQRTVLAPAHGALHRFLRPSSVSRHRFGSFLGWRNSGSLAFRFGLAKDLNHRSIECGNIVGISR